MTHEEQALLIDALMGMKEISHQVNLLLDGYEYLISTVGEFDGSNLYARQIKDGAQSMAELSELMVIIKKMVITINNGTPIRQNKSFKNEVLLEMILHMDMIRALLQEYEIHPEGYSATIIAESILDVKKCLLHY